MFSLTFTLVVLIAFGVNGQTNDINTVQGNKQEKGYPFGKLRLADEESKHEELIPPHDIESPEPNQVQPSDVQTSGVQPLPSPCVGTRSSTKIPYPNDKTKYIQCRDEYHYEISACPNGGEYNEQTETCDAGVRIINKCEEEKPCLNDGQCAVLGNATFKCTCRSDWIGERCETPINSCVQKPCGPNAECRSLKTNDYDQDYVCVCHGRQGYGLNCQEAVPNPCLTTDEQFFPFAFSQHAYIQCDGELIYFQPCGPILYWNQEEKICDRKRSSKPESKKSSKKLKSKNNNDVPQVNVQENIKEDVPETTTPVQNEQPNSFVQKPNDDNGRFFAFVPARIVNRQQFQNQQTGSPQNTQDLPVQSLQTADFQLNRQGFTSDLKQWPSQQTETNIRQPLTFQTDRSQPRFQNVQQQWMPTSTDSSIVENSFNQPQTELDQQQSQQNPQQQQQNQFFSAQKWLNQVPDMNTQGTQRFGAQPQSWQSQDQQMFVETTTPAPRIISFQGFQSQNTREQEQLRPVRPTTQLTGSQLSRPTSLNTQTFTQTPQSWQGSRTVQNQQMFLLPTTTTTTTPKPVLQSQAFPSQNTREQEQTWQQRPTTQLTGSNTQTSFVQPQTWQTFQAPQNKQPLTSVQQKIPFHSGLQQNTQQSLPNQGNNQLRQNLFQSDAALVDVQQLPFNDQQSFTGQFLDDQEQPQRLNTDSTFDGNNVQLQRRIQSQNNQQPQQDQAFGTQQRLNQVPNVKPQDTQRFVAQPQPQSWQRQDQQMFVETTTSAPKMISFQDFQSQNTREQEQPWQIKRPTQQLQNQPAKSPSSQIFAFKPTHWSDSAMVKQQDNTLLPQSRSQTEQFTGNTLETTTLPNKAVLQGLSAQNLRSRQPNGIFEQVQPTNNQIGQQTTVDQRKTQDSMPSLSSRSWPLRSK